MLALDLIYTVMIQYRQDERPWETFVKDFKVCGREALAKSETSLALPSMLHANSELAVIIYFHTVFYKSLYICGL